MEFTIFHVGFPSFIFTSVYLFVYIFTYMCEYVNIYGVNTTSSMWTSKDNCGCLSSLSTIWVLGIELRSSDLAASAFTHWPISLALQTLFRNPQNKDYLKLKMLLNGNRNDTRIKWQPPVGEYIPCLLKSTTLRIYQRLKQLNHKSPNMSALK